VACLSRILACIAAALVVAVPAHAANGDAPGALKKETPTAPDPAAVPAPGVPAPQAAPQATTPAAPKAQASPTAPQAAPVTKSTTNKVGQTHKLASAPTAGSTTPTTRAVRRSSTRRNAVRRTAATRRPTSEGRAVARGRPHGTRVRAHGRAGAPGRQIAAGAPATAPGQSRSVSDTAKPHAAAGSGKPKAKHHPAPLTSLSRAADRVIEVIPGAVVLALAGLTALVLVLILRSLAVERRRGRALAMSYGVTVEALATAIEAKDLTTGGHIERVRRLGLLLASEIVPRETRDSQMAYGFLLHDIGKLAVPDAILRAPGRLTEEQWALMRGHPEEGVRMLSTVPFLDRALDVVRHHHERWDGGGYPDGLRGEEIPLWARIFSVVDALDAMTAERPYRSARSYQAALEEIRRHSGTQFDPMVVEALERIHPAAVEPLLEPAQQVEPLAELPDVEPLVAA
jgi:HD-GYP domain-containing protein (c-di-GMP phosphodiesterase class II)